RLFRASGGLSSTMPGRTRRALGQGSRFDRRGTVNSLSCMRKILVFLIAPMVCTLSLSLAPPQQANGVQEQVRAYRVAHEKDIVGEFLRLLSLPNRATDTADIQRNSDFIQNMLEKRWVKVRLLRVPQAPPIILGEVRRPGARSTIGIYAHYDGQPVDPAQRTSPPFSPVVRDQSGKQIDWEGAANLDPE